MRVIALFCWEEIADLYCVLRIIEGSMTFVFLLLDIE